MSRMTRSTWWPRSHSAPSSALPALITKWQRGARVLTRKLRMPSSSSTIRMDHKGHPSPGLENDEGGRVGVTACVSERPNSSHVSFQTHRVKTCCSFHATPVASDVFTGRARGQGFSCDNLSHALRQTGAAGRRWPVRGGRLASGAPCTGCLWLSWHESCGNSFQIHPLSRGACQAGLQGAASQGLRADGNCCASGLRGLD
jgi:hypothetical protein